MVMCFEADGHVTLELGSGIGCQDEMPDTPVALDHSHTIAVSKAEPSHCGPCIDRPLLPGRFLSRQLSSDDHLGGWPVHHAAVLYPPVSPVSYSYTPLSSQLVIHRNTTSTLLRTVVLLI